MRTYIVEKMTYLNCHKPISPKAKYCSDACRMAYTKRTKDGEQPEQNDPVLLPEQSTRTFEVELTVTDKLFEIKRPNYYTFGKEVHKRECLKPDCKKKFTTRLKLLKFCSPEHQLYVLDMFTGKSTNEN